MISALSKLRVKLTNIIKLGTLGSIDDSGRFRFGNDTSSMGKTQRVNAFMPYGLIGSPPPGSMGILFSVQGEESKIIGLFDDPENRTKKDTISGEIGLSNYITGSYVLMKENGDIEIDTGASVTVTAGQDLIATVGGQVEISCSGDMTLSSSTKITFSAPEIEGSGTFTQTGGDASFGGNVNINGDSTASDHVSDDAAFNGHVHTGVQTGGSNTGGPV